jgi:hypothetical protein
MQVLISNTSCIMAYTITTSYLVLYVGPECFWCLHSCVMWLVSMWLVNSFTLDAYMGVASKICLWWTCFFRSALTQWSLSWSLRMQASLVVYLKYTIDLL